MNGPLPRLISTRLAQALKAMPAVVVTGARQTGKSTLVQALAGGPSRTYLSLDEFQVRAQARQAPEDLVRRPGPLTLDEVQREPDLLIAVKQAIDGRRTRGRFLLTGSANLLLMRRVSESLAGRAYYLSLRPMTRRELLGHGRAGLWGELISARDEDWRDLLEASEPLHEDWRDLARRGGYPTPALRMHDPEERRFWFEGYITTYLERDLQDLSAISALPDFRRLMEAACHRVGQLVNQAELGRDVSLPQPTVHRYLNLLETSYQLVRLPAYSVNRTRRLIKTAKLYWTDSALALHLAGEPSPSGAYLENLVLCDLLAWSDARSQRTSILYWRTATGDEVDFVIETSGSLVPIEVKATRRPGWRDTQHLQSFRAEYGRKARPGLLLHDGQTTEWLAPGVLAAPWWRVL
ncbi:MAG: ATP-binding protein [Longimicrobiales bacterium]